MDADRHTISFPPGAESSPDAGAWHWFTNSYCISLQERSDRRREARRQFRRVGLGQRVEFMLFSRHDDCERGIFESHLACLSRGLAAGAEAILVFEDDILFDGFSPAVLADCVHFMRTNTRWEAFFFGCLTRGITATDHPSVVGVRYRSLTHAYVVRPAFARRLVGQRWRGRPFDAVLADVLQNGFAACPAFAFQSDSPSDNSRRSRLERFRNLCGGLRRIQKANEFYQGHKRAIIAGHLLAVLALLLFLL